MKIEYHAMKIKEQRLVLLFFNKFPDDEESITIKFSPEKEYNEVIEQIKKKLHRA